MSKTQSKARNRFEFVADFKDKDVAYGIRYGGVAFHYAFFNEEVVLVDGTIDTENIPVFEKNGDLDYRLSAASGQVTLDVKRDRYLRSGIFRGDGVDDLVLVFDESLLDVNHDAWASPYIGLINVPCIKVSGNRVLNYDFDKLIENSTGLKVDYSEITDKYDVNVSDARNKISLDFLSTLRLIALSLRLQHLTSDNLSEINQANHTQLITLINNCAYAFYKQAVKSGKMASFPYPKATDSHFILPLKIVDQETNDAYYVDKSFTADYYISMKDWLTYITPMLKHVAGAYKGSGAIFTVSGNTPHNTAYEATSGYGMNFANLVRTATRSKYGINGGTVIKVVAGDVIIINTVDIRKFRCMPGIKSFLRQASYYELRAYRDSMIWVADSTPWGLFNDIYDSCVLVAVKHVLTDQEFVFSGNSVKRLVSGSTVNVASYEFKLNDLVKVKLKDVSDSYYTSNEIIKVRVNGNLLDIIDDDYFPIAAGDYATIPCDMTIIRDNGGDISQVKIKFNNDAYITSLQAPFNVINYSFNPATPVISVDATQHASLHDLLNNVIDKSRFEIKLFRYATNFAHPVYKLTRTTYRDVTVNKYTFDLSDVEGYADNGDSAYDSAWSEASRYNSSLDEMNSTITADYLNIACVVATSHDANALKFAAVYNIDYNAYIPNSPSLYYKMEANQGTWTQISRADFQAATNQTDTPLVYLGEYSLITSSGYEEGGSTVINTLSSRRNGNSAKYSKIGYSLLFDENPYDFVSPSVTTTVVHTPSYEDVSINTTINDISDILSQGCLTFNLIPMEQTVNEVRVDVDESNYSISKSTQPSDYTLDTSVSSGVENYVTWDLTIPNELNSDSVSVLFSEGDQQYIASHTLNVFNNRTGIAEIIASYVSPNLSEISPTLLADAQVFLQSGMRDSIEATLSSIESVLLDETGVIKSEDIEDTESTSLVYYVNKAGKVAKGIFNNIKNDIMQDSDVVDADIITNNSSELISVPRFNDEGQLVFNSPCKLDEVPTTLLINDEEVPLGEAVLYNKLMNRSASEINPDDPNESALSEYVSNMINIYGDYTQTMIENDMTNVIDEIAESNPEISLSDATALIQSKVDQVQADISGDPVISDLVTSTQTISSRLQAKIVDAAKKAKTTSVAIISDAYSKFGAITNGVSTKVSAFASRLKSCAYDLANAVVNMFGTGTEITKDNWSGSGNITNRSNLSLAFDINFPDADVIGAAKVACNVVGKVATKIYDKCANYVKKTFKDGVSFKINQAGYETLDCPAYAEIITLDEFRSRFVTLATYLESYRQEMDVPNITFVTQMNTNIIFIQLHADNYVKIVVNPLIDIEDTSAVKPESDLDFLDMILNAIERSVADYIVVCEKMNILINTLSQHYYELVISGNVFDTSVTFDRTKTYETVFAGAKVSTKEKKAKGWKIFGWFTAAVGAVLCCTGIASGVGAALMVGGASMIAAGAAIEASGQSKELQQVLKKAREDTAFANAEITSAELLGVWNSCPTQIGQMYLHLLPICFEGGYVHPGNGKLLSDDRYIPCAIFAGFPQLKYSLVTDEERAKETRKGLITITAVVVGTLVAARLATRKIRAKKKYKQACREQWYPAAPSRDSVYSDSGKMNPWYSLDKDGNPVFDQSKFNKAVDKYKKNQEKLAWKVTKYGNIMGGASSLPAPNYDGKADFDQLASIIGYNRNTR